MKTKKQQTIATAVTTLLLVFGTGMLHAYGQQSAAHVSLKPFNNHEIIIFTVDKEVNVTHYTIETGNDSLSFNIIGIVKPAGNSMLAHTYRYEIYEPHSKYYRIGTIGMNGRTAYTVISGSNAQKKQQPSPIQNEDMRPGKPLAAGKQ